MVSQSRKSIELVNNELVNIEPEAPIPQRIAFEPDTRRERVRNVATQRRRSASRDSISSVRSRARSVSGVPIEFRTLSYQVGDSYAVDDIKHAKKAHKDEDKERDYFTNLDFHLLDGPAICQKLNVNSDNGLDTADATARLARDGPNTFSGRRENYFKKLFFYVFGGFCSILWVGVIIFFICWRPLGTYS